MAGEGEEGRISSSCGILVSLTSKCITAVLHFLPAPGHPPAHVPVWDTLVRTGEVGILAKMFTVYVGVVAAGVAEVMDTSHYTSSTSPTLTVLCRHAALLGIFPEFYCCVEALTIISIIDALVPTSIIIVTISTSVTVLDHC